MRINYPKTIYSFELIRMSAIYFADICSVEITSNDKYWSVSFRDFDVDEGRLSGEFENFMLEYMNGAMPTNGVD